MMGFINYRIVTSCVVRSHDLGVNSTEAHRIGVFNLNLYSL